LRTTMTREEFIKEVTDGLATPPAYFPLNVMLNKQGYESITEVMKRGKQALSADAFESVAGESGAVILDTRDAQIFAKGFIPNSINIGIDGNFAPWVGSLIPDIKQQILIVADEGREEEVITRLARVGYDHTIGYLNGGFAAWENANRNTDQIESIDAIGFSGRMKRQSLEVLDVRRTSEYLSEHIVDAVSMPLDYINDHFTSLDKEQTYYIHCAGGYRSMIFASILKARGFTNLIDVRGGFKAIKETQMVPLTDYVCPTTLVNK
jgi:hydroxyacylglutathione hydrolase